LVSISVAISILFDFLLEVDLHMLMASGCQEISERGVIADTSHSPWSLSAKLAWYNQQYRGIAKVSQRHTEYLSLYRDICIVQKVSCRQEPKANDQPTLRCKFGAACNNRLYLLDVDVDAPKVKCSQLRSVEHYGLHFRLGLRISDCNGLWFLVAGC